MNWETYIAFGDSITCGARSYLGYPEYVSDILETGTNKKWNVINHAKSGYKAIDLVRLIDQNFQNLKNNAPSVCTLLIGTNDIKAKTDPEDFKIALNLLLIKIKLLMEVPTIKVFGIPLFAKGVMYPYSINMNDLIPAYNNIIQKAAESHGLQYFPLNFASDELFDGVHLNQKGCKNTADYVGKLILEERGL